jgi:hypothetical protein
MSSVAAFLRKVFVSIFDLVDAAFDCRGPTLTSAASWRGSLRHTSGILQCQLHWQNSRSLLCSSHIRIYGSGKWSVFNQLFRGHDSKVQAGNARGKVQLRCCKERIQMWPVLQLAWLWASGKGLFRCSVQRVLEKGRGWELSIGMMRVSELRTAAEAFKL